MVRLRHTTGVDGQFLRHFGVTEKQVLEGTKGSDAEVLDWFRPFPQPRPDRLLFGTK